MINDFLVIFDDEDIIGKVEEIRKYFLNELAIKLYTDDIDMTERVNILNMTQELIEKLENENDKSIIKVSYNPMGCFNIFHLEWENKEIKEGKKQEQKQCYTYEDKLRVKAEEGLEELYKITNNEIIRICIGWLEDRTEWNSDYANSMYEDIMNFIWDKYNLKKIYKKC